MNHWALLSISGTGMSFMTGCKINIIDLIEHIEHSIAISKDFDSNFDYLSAIFLVEEFESLLGNLTKDNIKNKKLVDIFINFEKIFLISEEFHYDYKIPFEFKEILDNRIEKETLSKEDLAYLNNPYSQPILYMIDCKLKYFK